MLTARPSWHRLWYSVLSVNENKVLQLISAGASLERFGEKDIVFIKWRSCRHCFKNEWNLIKIWFSRDTNNFLKENTYLNNLKDSSNFQRITNCGNFNAMMLIAHAPLWLKFIKGYFALCFKKCWNQKKLCLNFFHQQISRKEISSIHILRGAKPFFHLETSLLPGKGNTFESLA